MTIEFKNYQQYRELVRDIWLELDRRNTKVVDIHDTVFNFSSELHNIWVLTRLATQKHDGGTSDLIKNEEIAVILETVSNRMLALEREADMFLNDIANGAATPNEIKI